jgi:hypothetical protein
MRPAVSGPILLKGVVAADKCVNYNSLNPERTI